MPCVYALIDVSEPDVFHYIGFTTIDPARRLRAHKIMTGKSSVLKRDWVRSVVAKNSSIDLIVLEECPIDGIGYREIFWIRKCKEEGHPLKNMCPGGAGHINPTEETRQKLRLAMTGRKLSAQHVQKVADANRGKKRTEVQKNKIRLKAIGRKMTQSVRDALGRTAWSGKIRGEDHPSYGREVNTSTRTLMCKSRSKFTEEQVRNIFHRRVILGHSLRDIATDNKTFESAISLIANGKTWRHLNLVNQSTS